MDTRPNIAPVVTSDCTSSLFVQPQQAQGIIATGQVALTPTTVFHFQLIENGSKVRFGLEHTSNRPVWLGLAASPNGYMVGSDAVIGVPPSDEDGGPTQPTAYRLMGQTIDGVQPDPTTVLVDATIESTFSSSDDPNKYVTVMEYTKTLNDPADHVPITGGTSSAIDTFLYAVGEGHVLAYHEHRGQFQIDLSHCVTGSARVDPATAIVSSSAWTNSGLFALHGFLAALAWAFLTPFAITVAWFRTLVPSSWIYIHVFANVLSVFLTITTFLVALFGVGRQDGGDHFTKAHHWVGTFLLIFASYQVTNGFLRPPVERKDTSSSSQPPDVILLGGMIPVPRTPRELWHTLHQLTGLTVLAMGMYQVASGLNLYAMRFQTSSIAHYYWAYVGLFVLSLIALKAYVLREEDKARQGVLQAVCTTEPEEDGLPPTALS